MTHYSLYKQNAHTVAMRPVVSFSKTCPTPGRNTHSWMCVCVCVGECVKWELGAKWLRTFQQCGFNFYSQFRLRRLLCRRVTPLLRRWGEVTHPDLGCRYWNWLYTHYVQFSDAQSWSLVQICDKFSVFASSLSGLHASETCMRTVKALGNRSALRFVIYTNGFVDEMHAELH